MVVMLWPRETVIHFNLNILESFKLHSQIDAWRWKCYIKIDTCFENDAHLFGFQKDWTNILTAIEFIFAFCVFGVALLYL